MEVFFSMLQLGDEPNDAFFFFFEDEPKKRLKKGVEKISEHSLYQRGLGHVFFFGCFCWKNFLLMAIPPMSMGEQNGPCDQDANDDADSAQGKRPKKADESRRGVPTLSGGVFEGLHFGCFRTFKSPNFFATTKRFGAGGYLKSLL